MGDLKRKNDPALAVGVLAVASVAGYLLWSGGEDEAPAPLPEARIAVTAQDYGERWPLNVPDAVLGCESPDAAWMEAGGERYALNGGGLRLGLPRPDAVLKDPGVIALADFIEKAMVICTEMLKDRMREDR